MRRWKRAGAFAAGGLILGAAAAAAGGTLLWKRATARAVRRLRARVNHVESADAKFSKEQLAGLPDPVARYFDFVLLPGQRMIRHARVRWAGEFRLRKGAWSPFTADQYFTTNPPGFVWDARIRMGRLVPVRVRDAYLAGEGVMLGAVGAVLPVANQRGTPELAAGALSRYLGEAVWLPTALLPSEHLTWEAMDDTTARATLTDGAVSVSAEFQFGPGGPIVGVSMTRERDVKGRAVPTPFEATFGRDYRRAGSVMIPTSGEAAWILPEGRFAYWRGRPLGVVYEPAS
jgi:hypothetical protein